MQVYLFIHVYIFTYSRWQIDPAIYIDPSFGSPRRIPSIFSPPPFVLIYIDTYSFTLHSGTTVIKFDWFQPELHLESNEPDAIGPNFTAIAGVRNTPFKHSDSTRIWNNKNPLHSSSDIKYELESVYNSNESNRWRRYRRAAALLKKKTHWSFRNFVLIRSNSTPARQK